jgi:hypothetical protein
MRGGSSSDESPRHRRYRHVPRSRGAVTNPPRGVRTPACRVETRLDACRGKIVETAYQ